LSYVAKILIMPDKIDMNAFAFRNTTVEKLYNRVNAMNEKKPNVNKDRRKDTFEGPMGTGFKTEKPKTTA